MTPRLLLALVLLAGLSVLPRLGQPDSVAIEALGSKLRFSPDEVRGAADLDGDGRWELLTPDGWLQADLQQSERWQDDAEGMCPC